MVVITSNQRDVILDTVRRTYTEVALAPERGFHFPTGRRACEFVGYPPERLDRLPASVLESFADVGYPFAAGAVREGGEIWACGACCKPRGITEEQLREGARIVGAANGVELLLRDGSAISF